MKPTIMWKDTGKKPQLKFIFGKKLTTDDAKTAIDEWRGAFAEKPGERIVLIWDASNMIAYESEARRLWQLAIKDMQEQIDSIWLITPSNVVRMGATVMSVFTTLDIKTVRHEDQIVLD